MPSIEQVFNRRAAIEPCCGFQFEAARQKTRRLWISIAILGSFFVAELITGLWSGSLALQAEAGHILSDISVLVLTLVAKHFAAQSASKRATFGYQRIEILAALVNGMALMAIATFIGWEAINHLRSPEPVIGLPMLLTSVVGLVVNCINIALLHEVSHDDLNLQGVFLHLLLDAASSVGALIAALAIYLWNWTWVDAAISLLIAGLVIYSALPIIQQSWEILMEYAPRSIDPAEVEAAFKSFSGVESVKKLHIWTIGTNQIALAAHLSVNLPSHLERDRLLKKLAAHLKQEFGITESTLQLTSATETAIALHPLLDRNLIDLFSHKNN